MRRKDREVKNRNEICEILDRAVICHLAMQDDPFPYVVPMHFGYVWDGEFPVLYLHCAKEGRKLDLLQRNSNVCALMEGDVTLLEHGEDPCKYSAGYASVIVEGIARTVQDPTEKCEALSVLMKKQTGKDFVFTEAKISAVEVLKVTGVSCSAKAHRI